MQLTVGRLVQRVFGRSPSQRRHVRRPAWTDLHVEALENRQVLSAVVSSVVNSITNAATGSLAGSGSTETVKISGTGFTGANNVEFGGKGVSKFTVVSDLEIDTSYPADSPGTVQVQVNVPTGLSNGVPFTYEAPVVKLLTPDTGPLAGGTPVTITGQYFTGASAVFFGKVGPTANPPFIVVSDTTITTQAPLVTSAQTVDVTVSVSGVASATSSNDLYAYAPPPSVTGLSPNTGPNAGGTPIVINGASFTGATVVKFGDTPITSFSVNDLGTQITIKTPAGSGTEDVTVTTPDGTSALNAADQFQYATIPLYVNVPQDVAVKGMYMTMYGQLDATYQNTFGTTISSGTNVYLVNTGSGYDYVPLSDLGSNVPLPPFLATSTALTNVAVQIPNVAIEAGRVVLGAGAVTAVAAASNGRTLPQSTISVLATAEFPTSGALEILTKSGTLTSVSYSDTSASTFKGASGGSGTLETGATVRGTALLTSVVGNQTIPTTGGTLQVTSTSGFPSNGTLFLATNSGDVQVAYTGTSPSSFTIAPVSAAIKLYTGNAVSGAPLPAPATNSGGGVAAPTPGNEGNNIYDFFELTYKPDSGNQVLKMTINTSQIDQFGLPMTLTVDGGSVQPNKQVGIELTRQQIMGVPGAGNGQFAQFVSGTSFEELTTDGFGSPSTARVISPGDQLTVNTVQNVVATPQAGGTLTAGTYYYAITALVGTHESTVSQLGQAVLASSGGVNLVWSASQNDAVTSYNVYRGVVSGQTVTWYLVTNVSTPTYPDTGIAGTSVAGIPLDPLSTYFDQAITGIFSTYTASNPLIVTVTDGSQPANGFQYTFQGVAEPEPAWVTTAAGASATPRTVLAFTCTSIANNPHNDPVLIPIGSQFFVYEPLFNSNSTNLSLPSPPAWGGTPYTPYNFIPSAQVFAANGVFADNVPQSAALYNNANEPTNLSQNAYSVALGSIEDEIDAALLRGIGTTINPVNWANSPTLPTAEPGPGGKLSTTQTYYYVITALDTKGESTASSEVSFQPINGSATLNWVPVNGASAYNVYRGTAAGAEDELIGTVNGQTNTTFNDTLLTYPLPSAQPPASGAMTAPVVNHAAPSAGGSLTAGQAYFYEVTALGVTGESIGSHEVSVTPAVGQQSVALNWNTIGNASAYKIYRGTSSGQENVLVGTLPGQGSGTSVNFTDSGGVNQNAPPNVYYAPGTMSDLYAQFFHQTFASIGGLAYADPFDDQGNQSSTMVLVSPQSVTLSLGHWGTVVTPSSANLSSGSSLVINGAGFDLVAANNTVTLSSGAASVTQVNSTGTQMILRFTAAPSAGPLTATVTTAFGGNSSPPVEVANVVVHGERPVTRILSGPALSTVSTSAEFTFAASESGTTPDQFTYLVRVDGGAFHPVAGQSDSVSNLTVGLHTFEVEATDTDGQTSDPAAYTWRVTEVSRIVIHGGTGQSAFVGTMFANPIVATLLDNAGDPVSDALVSFVVLPSTGGASASIANAVSDRSGTITVYPTANMIPGTYQVKAISGVATSSFFSLTNTTSPGPAPNPITWNPLIAAGTGPGLLPRVQVFNADGSPHAMFFAYAPRFRGGVRATVADMNHDGVDDIIVAPARGGLSLVEVIDGTKLNMVLRNGQIDPQAILASFHAYPANLLGGVVVTTAEFNKDGTRDLVVSAGGGVTWPVEVVDGSKLLQEGNGSPISPRNLPLIASIPTQPARVKSDSRTASQTGGNLRDAATHDSRIAAIAKAEVTVRIRQRASAHSHPSPMSESARHFSYFSRQHRPT